MNPPLPAEPAAPQLVDIVQLKWLLAGYGIRLHVERLLAEPEYATALLLQAAQAPGPGLREAAQRVRRHLGIP